MSNFVKLALKNGGSIHPLIISASELQGPTITNPSIYNDNGKIIVNLRNINYTLYHSEKKTFEQLFLQFQKKYWAILFAPNGCS